MSSRRTLTNAPAWRPTPMAALELAEVPTDQHFVRDHFPVPLIDPDTWLLEIAGETQRLVLDL